MSERLRKKAACEFAENKDLQFVFIAILLFLLPHFPLLLSYLTILRPLRVDLLFDETLQVATRL